MKKKVTGEVVPRQAVASLTRQLAEASERADDGWKMFEDNAAEAAAATNRAKIAEEQLAEAMAEKERMRKAFEREHTDLAGQLEEALAGRKRMREGLEWIVAQQWNENADLDDIFICAVAALSPPREESGEPR